MVMVPRHVVSWSENPLKASVNIRKASWMLRSADSQPGAGNACLTRSTHTPPYLSLPHSQNHPTLLIAGHFPTHLRSSTSCRIQTAALFRLNINPSPGHPMNVAFTGFAGPFVNPGTRNTVHSTSSSGREVVARPIPRTSVYASPNKRRTARTPNHHFKENLSSGTSKEAVERMKSRLMAVWESVRMRGKSFS